MVSIILCDDDVALQNRLHEQISEILESLGVKAKIHKFRTMEEISDRILAGCDIAFLDIDLDNADYNGLDIARRIRTLRKDTVIIFVTNFIEYAPEGYEVQAFRYILKRDLATDVKTVLPLALKQRNRETLPIQVNGEIIKLPIEDILYLEVQQHNVTVVTKQRDYSFYATLAELEGRLEPFGFLRIHKSYLVNMKHLKKFQCREATLDNGTTLRVGEKSYAANKEKYLLWKGWQG